MARFEIQTPEGRFEVQAPDEDTAMRVLSGQQPESQQSKDGRAELSALTTGFEKDRGDSALRNVDSFMRGAADIASFGLSDELSALAGGTMDAMMGKPDQYKRRLLQERVTQEIRDRSDPVASTLGRLAGGVGSGVGLAKAGLSLSGKAAGQGIGARMLAGAGDGAAFGGAYGLGSGEGIADRLKQGAGGAIAGGVIGGAVPGLVAGTKAVTKPFTDAVRARVNPSGFASEKVAERLSASNMTPQTVARKMAINPGSSVADLGGKSTRDLLRTAVNIPGPAKDRVAKQVAMRQFGQGDRLKSAVGRTFADPDGYLTAKDDLANAAKQIASPLYQKAYARPVHYSKELEDILETPAGKAALSKAQSLAANEQQPFQQAFIDINGVAKRVPDTRGWDYIKRAMDDMIEGQTDAITKKVTNEGRILLGLKNRMLAEVDRYNPDYKAARAAFGGVAQIDEALEFGREALSMAPEAVRRRVAGMSATQKEAARIGAAEDMRKAIDAAGFTNNAVLKVFNSRQRVQNLRALFDNDRQFAEFRKTIFQEARKRQTYDAVKGNSTTASQLADMFEAGGTSQTVGTLATAATQGPVNATLQFVGSTLRRLGGLTPKVADEISKRLMTTDPQQLRTLVTELRRIEQMQVSAAQKSQLIQSLVSRVLTVPTVGAIAQTR